MNKPIITTTEQIGFCFGVKRTIEALYKELEKDPSPIYTFGEIVHNPDVNTALRKRNVFIEEDINKIPKGSRVFIRTHGLPKKTVDILENSGLRVFDMTCPRVRLIHNIVSSHSSVIVAGDKNHPEVEGIRGHCPGECFIVKTSEELEEVLSKLKTPTVMVSQTTFNKKVFDSLAAEAAKNPLVTVKDTICDATSVRQKQVEELAKKSDFFVVIGGKNSSNTNKLYEIASQYCKTVKIERKEEMPALFNYKKIGLSSGASTPAETIEEVINYMANENEKILNVVSENTASEEDFDFAQALEESLMFIHNGQRVSGTVSAITGTEVQIDLGGKHSGFIPTEEFDNDENPVKVGDTVEAIVVKVNDAEGTALLSKRKIDAAKNFEKLQAAMDNKEVLTGKVKEAVKGGLIVNYAGIRVFIPASHVSLRRNAELDKYVGEEVKFEIISTTDGKRRKIVGSMKEVLLAEKAKLADELWGSIEVGKEYEGTVVSTTSFGAFVNIGGADGLLHVTDIAWTRVKNVTDYVKVGDKVKVKIKSYDPDTKKISLTMKNDEENPWELIKKYNEGDVITVKVLKIMPYGAFVSVIPGIDGLIHISQLSNKRVANVADVVSVGDEVEAKITEIDYDNKKVSLSIRALLPEEPVVEETVEEEDKISEEDIPEGVSVETAE